MRCTNLSKTLGFATRTRSTTTGAPSTTPDSLQEVGYLTRSTPKNCISRSCQPKMGTQDLWDPHPATQDCSHCSSFRRREPQKEQTAVALLWQPCARARAARARAQPEPEQGNSKTLQGMYRDPIDSRSSHDVDESLPLPLSVNSTVLCSIWLCTLGTPVSRGARSYSQR